MVKGFLRSPDGLFQLSPSVTLVGRENCDFNILLPSVELQHAVIEYSDAENCFVIQDLNTAHGTYVNDCRVQNAAVRLAPGDVIRFGYSGLPHELEVEDAQVSYPPVPGRTTSGSGMKVVQESIPVSDGSQHQLPYLATIAGGDAAYNQTQQSLLPSLSGSPGAPTAWGTQQGPGGGLPSGAGVVPRPPRARPTSAGARRGSGSGPGTGGTVHISSQSPTNSPLPPRRAVTGGWVGSGNQRGMVSSQQVAGSPNTRASPVSEVMATHEKDQKLLRMGDEINRLAVFEAESQRKDGVIGQLRTDVESLSVQLHQAQQQASLATPATLTRMKDLEKEVNVKQMEVNALKEKMSKMRTESSDPMENVAHLRSLLHQRERELVSLRQELEKLKKEKGTTSALMTKLQRDLTTREGTVSRLKGEVELMKKELREKEVALSALAAKFSRMRETKKHEEELAARSKEVVTLKHKLKGAESKIETLTQQIASQKEEIDDLQTQTEEGKKTQERYASEKEDLKKKFLESQRTEKQARVDIEQARKQLERFRTRVMQTAFSAPGFRVPDDESEVTDDSLVETMKQLIAERTEARGKVRELKDLMKGLESSSKETKSSHKNLKQHLIAAEKRLEEGGRTCAHLRNEIKLLQSVTVDESLQNVKDTIAMMLQNELSWQQAFESTLEKCGFDIKTGGKDLEAHVENLRAQCEKERKLKENAQVGMTSAASEVRSEMERKLERQQTEYETTMKDALERLKLEGDQKIEAAVEAAQEREKSKLEETLQTERQKVQQQEASLEQLRQALMEKGSDEEKYVAMETSLKSQIDALQQEESKLREELRLQEETRKSSASHLEGQVTELISSHEKQVAAFKEQIHQHALTIVSLEERAKKAVQEQSASKKEVKELEKKLAAQAKEAEEELKRIKASTPAKPVIVTQPSAEVPALQHTINLLKKENGVLKKEIQDQQDVVLALRRDLAGASARLSDLTGELSERQKEEMENQKTVIRDQEAELTTQRQQLVKLSELVDRKSQEMENLTKEITAQKELLLKQKKDTALKDSELNRLAQQLNLEQEQTKRAKEEVEQEGLITSELSSVGAQCRGERHAEVITRQREALGELRGRIKGLEQNRPPMPTHDQALQQVILLKKELAEMRAKQAQLSALSGQSHTAEAMLEREVAKARGQVSTSVSDAAIERSARVEIQQSMDKSETAYMELMSTVARLLGLGEVPGQESLCHLPRDERQRIMGERGSAHELITSRLRTLNQRLERKDALLQDYEKDLEKLRLAERVANEKAGQVESLAGDVRSRQEEAHYLRETLRRTREELDKERRLNSAIKSKKTFHMENDEKNRQVWPKHKCYEDEMKTNKRDAKKKLQKEKIIRKEYELDSLKAELQAKDQQLCETTARLINMENAVAMT
ncbi:forkhead-associated domain-containing protein 1-like [Diadema antillarum]|uniref:forkhead-associated domain-containing protein 1-like n=1 Tax=Diadema antillarum TaxID=105358 RepID=UPI003A854D7A